LVDWSLFFPHLLVMNRLITVLMLAGISVVGEVQARLGETLPQCEERYGKVVEKREARLDKSDVEACVFSKAGISILVEFRAGIAWNIQYRSIDLGTVQVTELLKANMPEGGGWSAAFEVAGSLYRLSTDRRMAAAYRPGKRGDVGMLEISSRDYAELTYALYEQEINRVVGSQSGRAGAGGLKGF
jgi:hypothetical protein